MKKSKLSDQYTFGVVYLIAWLFILAATSVAPGALGEGINYKPQVENNQIVKTLYEDAQPGAQIAYLKQITSDTENDKITFSIDAIGEQLCNIDTETGNITLKARLDREIESKYKFQAFAEDDYQGGGVNRRTPIAVFLYVLDVNDNSPFFEGTPYLKSIPENISLNSLVLTVLATDRDEGRNGDVSYGFKNGTSTKQFSIDSSKGEIRVTSELDYERAQRHTLVVVATDDGENPLSSQTTLIIDVLDVSDTKPRFLLSSYQGEIPENSPMKTEVVKVTAIDGDVGINNDINYEIVSGNGLQLFVIDRELGNITVNGLLDREKGGIYNLKIKGYEVPDPSSYSLVDVIIFIQDVNDNKPQFKQELYTFTLNENTQKGYVIIDRLDAVDNDALPINRQISYSMSGDTEPFAIDSLTGSITVTGTLDFEVKESYTIQVKATETSTAEKYSGTATVKVELINLNDNSPIFQESKYNFTAKESVPIGSSIGQVHADDEDKGPFGKITYQLTGENSNLFKINADTGLISSSALLDYEKVASFSFIVSGRDEAGIYSKTASAVVLVLLEDVNDNTPRFLDLPDTTEVQEGNPPSIIYTLKANDPDTGANGQVTFALLNSSLTEFQVDSVTGRIKNLEELDYEKYTQYILAVAASDKGSPPLISVSYLTVRVKDINDNAPVFNQSAYTVAVNEAIPIGSSVISLTANDADSGLNGLVTYSIHSGNNDNLFHISSNGEITTRNSLDREEKALHRLMVIASDSGTPRQSTNVTVTLFIEDSNDNVPAFEKTRYQVAVNESETVGKKLLTVKAKDMDEGINALLSYRIVSGNDEGKFRLDNVTGDVYLQASLDWETTVFYTLVIEAKDGGTTPKAITTLLTVEVIDSNDNAPVFREKSYSFQILENSPLRTSLGIVTADDADGKLPPNSNGIVSYSIKSGNIFGNFEIDPQYGTLRTNKSLDREVISFYNLTVCAMDHGKPPRSASVIVYVTILDLNDNAPKFSKEAYAVHVFEDVEVGTKVIEVKASDPDSGDNGFIKYSISSGNTDGAFTVDQYGIIRCAKLLDRESTSEYILQVTATDGAASKQATTVQVTIFVDDVNDNAPQFVGIPYRASVVEEAMPGVEVWKVSAIDKDSEDNGRLAYHIQGAVPVNSFAINAGGVITTTVKLDRETYAHYTINVTAEDHGSPIRVSSTLIEVTVEDVNDFRPRLLNLPKTISVKEDVGGGLTVLTVEASDKDEGRNKQLSYFIVSGSFGKFLINENTGELKTSPSRFDREMISSFNLTINVTDHGSPALWTSSYLLVEVEDVNDNAPQFIPNPDLFPGVYTSRIEEGSDAIGKIVVDINATDADAGLNAEILYEIIPAEGSEYFKIGAETGIIKVSKAIDREDNKTVLTSSGLGKFDITVKATDKALVNPQSALAKVTVYVTDINDNAPKFTAERYFGTITEGSRITQDVVQVFATDSDLGFNARIQYSIQSGNDGGAFAIIDPFIGKISVAKLLNTEVQSNYSLVILATDDASKIGGISQSSTAIVDIYVGDINDNDPIFTQGSYQAAIFENATKGSFVAKVMAHDSDQGDNGKIAYSFTAGNGGKLFGIDAETGEVRLTASIDRELTPVFILTVKAEDKGFPSPRKTLTTLTVQVLDINDNAPYFPLSVYEGHVIENAALGTKVSVGPILATDADEGVNAVVHYSIIGTDSFAVNGTSGELFTKSTVLDRETRAKYQFQIVAADKDGLNTSARVLITLDDVNDNAPSFEKPLYNVTVSEDASVGEQIAQVTATDRDTGINADLSYRLEGGEGKFYIDRIKGEIRLNSKLDRESEKEFEVTITASDNGKPSREGSTKVNIFISDVLDSAPIFSPSVVNVKVFENITIGGVVFYAKAIDTDDHDNVTYRIVQQSNEDQFAVDATSGGVRVQKLLDREKLSSYSIQIRAEDSVGLSSINRDLKLEIEVLDVNDNAPRFLQAFYYNEIVETTPNGAIILTVQATDVDSGSNREVRYSFVQDGPSILRIDSERGLITKQGDFTSSQRRTMNFSVRATDLGNPAMASMVPCTIVWVAVNADSPKFTETQYEASIREDASINTVVIKVTATEQDSGRNGKITYYLVGSQGTFKINSETGDVTIARQLDRETQHTYTMTVSAQDGGIPPKEGMSSITVTVLDANDKAPKFSADSYSFSLLEGDGFPRSVGRVTATDDDLGVNSELRYTILQGDTEGWFEISPETGMLSTKAKVDREKISSLSLVVRATDLGNPPLSSTVQVTINILDENDNSPAFEKNTYNAEVREDAFGGKQILTVRATDPDLGPNGDITYRIESGNNKSSFAVGAKTGIITIANSLDYEDITSFILTLEAADGGVTRRKAYCTVNVAILDVNDERPTFTKSSYTFAVYETASKNHFLGKVSANDEDRSPLHKTVYYEIKNGNIDNTFHIQESTGEIYLNRLVDREEKASYLLTLSAFNRDVNGNKVMESEASLTVNVLDVNDNSPFFQPNCCNATVSEGASVGDTVIRLSATDNDDGTNKQITYSIIGGNEEGLFTITNPSGELKVEKKLDREKQSMHNLVVMASDQGTPVLSANVTVKVKVLDVNDERPEFQPITIDNVFENATIGTVVTTFVAIDKDLGENGKVRYYIISGDPDKSFSLDPVTGELKVARLLDYERIPVYNLRIDALDQGNPPLSNHKLFEIQLININDNIPIFFQASVTASVYENQSPGAVVATISASDADADQVYYYITEGNTEALFQIDRETGILRTTQILDREYQEFYRIKVFATNDLITPITRRRRAVGNKESSVKLTSIAGNNLSYQTIMISVSDINDNSPRFTQYEFNGGVSEDAKYDSSVLQVQAIDRDTGNSSRLVYSIVDANKDNAFIIEPETGWLKTAMLFSGMTGTSYTYKVMVKDNGGKWPYFNHTADVKLFILTDLQRVVVTMKVIPDKVKERRDEFKRVLENVTGFIINIDEIQYSTNNGNIDFSATDMLIHAVDPATNKILNREVVLEKIDKSYPALFDFFTEWKVTSVKAKLSPSVAPKSSNTTTILIAIAASLVLVVIGFAFALYHLRKRQRRKLKAATASASNSDAELKQRVHLTDITENGTLQPKVYTIEGSNSDWFNPTYTWINKGSQRSQNSQSVALLEEYNNREFLSTFQRNGNHEPQGVTEIYLPDVYTDIDVDEDDDDLESEFSDEEETLELPTVRDRPKSRADLLLAASVEGLGTLEKDGNLVTAI